MKAVLRLMTINFSDPGMRVFLGICVVVFAVTFSLQHTVLEAMPPARRSLFVMQFILLAGFLVPWSLIHPRSVIVSGWKLVPWARHKIVIATATIITLLAAVSGFCYVAGMAGDMGDYSGYLVESVATFPSTFVLLSLFGLQIMASATAVWRQVAIGLVGVGAFVAGTVYSMARGLPRVTDEMLGGLVWLAFGASVLAWVLGGWWFVSRRPVAATRSWRLREFFAGLRARRLLRQGPVVTQIRGRWSPMVRMPTVFSWFLLSLAPLLSQPVGARDGFITAAAFFAFLGGLRAVVITLETVRSARILWLVSGNRDELFQTCSRMLIRNTTYIGACAGIALFAIAWSADRVTLEGNVVGILSGFSLCVFVPHLAIYMGLHGASLPESAMWGFSNVWIIIGFVTVLPVVYAFTDLPYDATGLLSIYAAITLLSMLAVRWRARRTWRRVDWAFLPTLSPAVKN